MIDIKHWANYLETGDRVNATIRHKTDGSKNMINVNCIVVENFNNESEINVYVQMLDKIFLVPYNELKICT